MPPSLRPRTVVLLAGTNDLTVLRSICQVRTLTPDERTRFAPVCSFALVAWVRAFAFVIV